VLIGKASLKDTLMRILPSVVWLLGGLTLAGWCRPAEAQTYPPSGYDGPEMAAGAFEQTPYDMPAAYPGMGYPGAYPDAGYGIDPMLYQDPEMMMDPSGPPPDMSAFPYNSPFGPNVNQYAPNEGVWMNRQIFGNRKYFMSLEYLRANLFRPGTDIIGSRTAQVPQNAITDPVPTNASIIGDGEDLRSDGLRGTFSIVNPDHSGFDATFWWVAEGNQERSPYGRGDPGDFTTLHPRGVIGMDDGTDTGVAVRFDTEFELGYKSQAFGSDLTFRSAPFWEGDYFRMSMLYGAKYVKVREQFAFHGADSALDYTFNTANPASPIPATVTPNPFGNPNFESDLVSRTKSDVIGPEIGVHYEIGGQHFLLSGSSRFSVAANNEMAWVYGNQIGDGFNAGFPTPTILDPKPSDFSHRKTHVHVSPVFHQSFGFKSQVFRHLPIVNEWGFFADANLKLGYDFILIGEMARPTKSIDWRVNAPRIESNRSRWNTQLFSVGMEWNF